MNVVIYARFSSHSQTEQSIEGQLKVCYEYAESNHYTVVGEYIDRAISGTTDNRVEFQRMISDSDKHTFEGVLVYQLDRFARNRYDSAINKAKLKKNGVRVLSAKENIADDASGILVEGVLESMAEYYSVELSQKIHRGMAINAEKCLSNGSNPGLGFKVDAERRFYVDEEEAAVVREIYERYASGETKAEIIRDLKRRRVKTSLGKEFSPNSLSHLLSNKRYIGVYLYKGRETPGGMPRILDDDLFYRVQSMMNKNKNAPARTHGEGEYLLTTKLFCGHCKEMMVGYGGTSKTGRQYHYYMCKNARRKKCGKKIVSKSYIEDRVVNECLKMLTEEKIRFIAKKVAEECAKSPDNLTAKALKKAIREADTAIENLWKAIEQGQAVEMLTERLNKRIAEKAELEAQLAVEENKKITLTEAQILAFLDYVCEMPSDDVNKRRAIINIFVQSIYLYDDHFTLIINASKKPLSINLHGGSASVDELNALDGEETARQLIESGSGTVTPYGVVYDNGIKLGQIYDGRSFPCYYYEPNAITVAVTSKAEPEDTNHITWLFLPMVQEEIDRALLRGGITDPADVRLRLEDSQLPIEVDVLLDMEYETLSDLNELAAATVGLSKADMEKLGAVAMLAKPKSAAQIKNLAESLDLFDFAPSASTPEEYGKYMIRQSGHFDYDENLDAFYDYEKYGTVRMNEEDGMFTDRGYIAYKGYISMEEVMNGGQSSRMMLGGLSR